jgi:hypothetical protein
MCFIFRTSSYFFASTSFLREGFKGDRTFKYAKKSDRAIALPLLTKRSPFASEKVVKGDQPFDAKSAIAGNPI